MWAGSLTLPLALCVHSTLLANEQQQCSWCRAVHCHPPDPPLFSGFPFWGHTVEFELRREIKRLQEYRAAGITNFCSKYLMHYSAPSHSSGCGRTNSQRAGCAESKRLWIPEAPCLALHTSKALAAVPGASCAPGACTAKQNSAQGSG